MACLASQSSLLGRCYYQLAGLTIEVLSDDPIGEAMFSPKFASFRIEEPGADRVSIHHHFGPPPTEVTRAEGIEVYRRAPWAVYRRDDHWVYEDILPNGVPTRNCYAVFNTPHTRGDIYHTEAQRHVSGWPALTMLQTDQIWLARVLADHQACYLHAAGMIMQGQGLLFLGHSGAGKTTTVRTLQQHGELLCDDRIVVRRWPEGFRIHGTWSHGDIPTVSSASAPLRGLLFLEQAGTNCLIPITDRMDVLRRLFFLVIRPAVTADWWEKSLQFVEQLIADVPAYRLQLDTSGKVVDVIRDFCAGGSGGHHG